MTVQLGGSFEMSEVSVVKADGETIAAAACLSSRSDQYEATTSEAPSSSKLEEMDESDEVECPRTGQRELDFGPEAGSGSRGEV